MTLIILVDARASNLGIIASGVCADFVFPSKCTKYFLCSLIIDVSYLKSKFYAQFTVINCGENLKVMYNFRFISKQ